MPLSKTSSEEPRNPFSRLEFHRTGIGLLPDPHEVDPGVAVHLAHVAGSQRPLTFCSCASGRRGSCHHLQQLRAQVQDFQRAANGRNWAELYQTSVWHGLAQVLHEGGPVELGDLRVAHDPQDGSLRFVHVSGAEPLRFLEQSPATIRFLERIGKIPPGRGFADRNGLLRRLHMFLRSPDEQHLNKAGMFTNRQSFEGGLWWHVAYHGFRELGEDARFRLRVDLRTGGLYFQVSRVDAEPAAETPVFEVAVAPAYAARFVELLQAIASAAPVPVSASALFRAGPDTMLDAPELRSAVELLVAHGEETLDEDPKRAPFRYGELAFVEELGVLVRLDDEAHRWADRDPEELRLLPARIETFRTEAPHGLEEVPSFLEAPLGELGIFTEFDYMELIPDENGEDEPALSGRGSELKLDVRYGFGADEVSLTELLRAKESGQPYYQTSSGWIDLNAPSLRGLSSLLRRKELREALKATGGGDSVRLNSAELLRLRASSAKPIRVEGLSDRSQFLQRFLDLRPAEPLELPAGLRSELRAYQRLGLEWLKFLYDNRLGGLLCDDMGLGKTHQAMGLMVMVREQKRVQAPFLVVSPRTVISHWRNKLRDYAPDLRAVQYHGPQRDLDAALAEGDVVLTSYGVLRNDVKRLQPVDWGLVIFDEIQQIKNRATQGYQAAAALRSRLKLGLTGTPVENSLDELKSLFDLVLPGYLGTEDDFRDRHGTDLEPDDWHLQSLRRLTAPFVLRRIKTAVLDELPEKIEDVRTCGLSDEQLSLYRQTIATKGVALMKKLENKSEPLPYIHIFALLNLLKQICDHPALALGELERFRDFESGKWDLFQELLEESLDSGQKVVVFTQYLGMIDIMQRHLKSLNVPYTTLTGASRNRGDIVDRFNNEPECRVFLGSLKAGGTGIDLVGGSVVIHYDRWWNAAREDQATDRLYRIGQKRVVQVFKLVTENTLEERIAMIIERKRRLMESVVVEDDPKLNKIFTREELIELLREPE
ncbi:MAG TPA: DEAD/DEAH box helicase [Thermoanaerobaculia bacterium]|nr:DEAD/DEAH box helicase [Thermoanaerobaculia bacterium]